MKNMMNMPRQQKLYWTNSAISFNGVVSYCLNSDLFTNGIPIIIRS
jgi:hypothetical protein